MFKKKSILTILVFCLMSLCLGGCTDKDYTRKDADKMAKSYSRKYKFVDEQVVGEKETIWTYYDEKLDWNFTVHEYPYISGFDGAHWNARRLDTDYDELIRDYILNMDEVQEQGFSKGRKYSEDCIYANVSDRDDLQDKVSCLQNVVESLNKKTKKKTYDIEVRFMFGDTSDGCDLDVKELAGMEETLLKRAYISYDEAVLKHYSDRELKLFVKENSKDEVQFIYQNGKIERTGILVYGGSSNIFKKAFKHWLENNGYEVTGTDDEYSFTTSDGESITIDYHTDGNGDTIGFNYVIKTLKLKDIKVDSM